MNLCRMTTHLAIALSLNLMVITITSAETISYETIWGNGDGTTGTAIVTMEFDRMNGQNPAPGLVTGYYEFGNGRIFGYIDAQGILTGYWIQDSSSPRCAATKAGSPYYGKLYLQAGAADGGPGFHGNWGACDENPSLLWDGRQMQ